SGAALLRGLQTSISLADAMAKNAQTAGVAVQQFSALAHVGDLNRVSQDQLRVSTRYLAEWMEKTGQVGRDLTEVMMEQADIIAAMPDGAEKLNYVYDRFGRSGQMMIPMLNQGSAALREQ